MAGYECYHCRQFIEDKDKKSHDCWTTTEEALTQHLSEDLLDAWLRIRETATDFGEQRIYASHKSIMFSRKHCYFFVRPQKKYLEVCVFLGKSLKHPMVHKVMASSKVKFAHLIRITHRDEVEVPFTEWLRESYEFIEAPRQASPRKAKAKPKRKPKAKKKSGAKPPVKRPRRSA